MKRPSRVRIFGRAFTIALSEADSPNLGQMFADEAKIEIRPDQEAYAEKDTLLHEVMHAIRHQQGYEDGGEVEESYVRSLATGVLGVLQDNPTFAKWLIAK